MNEKIKLNAAYKKLVDEMYDVTEALSEAKKNALLFPNYENKQILRSLECRYVKAKKDLDNYKAV